MTSRRSRYDTIFGAFPSVISGGTSDLYTKLVAYWKLEEASGTRADAKGSNTLTDGNTVTQQTGKIGSCGQFTSANTETLYIADNATLRTGDIDFALSAWVYSDSTPGGIRQVIGKWGASTKQEYRIRFNNGNSRFEAQVSSTGVDAVQSGIVYTYANATWFFVMMWHDATNNLLGIRVNESESTQSHLLGVYALGDVNFSLGGSGQASPTQLWDGRIDEAAFWKSYIPSSTERTWLYNSGSGRSFQNIYDYV